MAFLARPVRQTMIPSPRAHFGLAMTSRHRTPRPAALLSLLSGILFLAAPAHAQQTADREPGALDHGPDPGHAN